MWSVAALMAEVEDVQEKKTQCDHSVEHSINLINNPTTLLQFATTLWRLKVSG